MAQFRTLCAVEQQPAISLSGLAEHLGASLPTASRLVGGLVSKGLLLRTGCRQDRRQLALALTPAGRSVLDRAWVATHKHMQGPLQQISAEQRATVVAAMDILRVVFGSAGLRDPLPTNPCARGWAGELNGTSTSRRRGLEGAGAPAAGRSKRR